MGNPIQGPMVCAIVPSVELWALKICVPCTVQATVSAMGCPMAC